MAKQSGVGIERLFIDGNNVSGNIGAFGTIAASRSLTDMTDITQSAFHRVGLLQEGQMSFNAWWDGTPATGAHQVLKGLRNAGVCTFTHGLAVGDIAASIVADQVDYQVPRSPDGTLAATIEMQSTGGIPLEWGVLLSAGPTQTFASAGNGSDVDDLAGTPTSTAFGASLYVHVLSLSGTSVTVKVQDAATLPTYADVAGLTTTAITPAGAPTAQRVVTSSPTATIRRYVRIVTTGTFTNAVVVAALVRNMAAQG